MVLNLAVPANAHLVLSEITSGRPFVLVKVGGIKIQAVDVTFGVFTIWAADLAQQSVGKANIPR